MSLGKSFVFILIDIVLGDLLSAFSRYFCMPTVSTD